MFHFMQIVVAPFVWLFYPTKVVGKKNIPKGACIIVGNHTTNLDAVLVATHTWEKKIYLAKKELFKNPLLGLTLKIIGTIKVDRNDGDLKSLRKGLEVLKKNKKLVVYPEGTRVHNKDMELGEFKSGVAMFAIKGKVPIVPIYLVKPAKLFRPNRLIIGKPFTLEEFYEGKITDEKLKEATAKIKEQVNAIREEYLLSKTKKQISQ